MADVDQRFEEAVAFFGLAVDGFNEAKQFDDASNAYLDLGLTQTRLGDRDGACSAFAQAVESYQAYLRHDPNSEVRVPDGYESYDDFVATLSKAAGC